MELWYTEKQTPAVGITCRVQRTLHVEQTPYQDLAVIDTDQFGRMLVLDGMVQTTIADEFVYHEMIAHVAMSAHPHPRRVAVVGGGDGGAIREVLRHPTVEMATLIEIDRRVVEVSREHLPELAGALSDPRVQVLYRDGIAHMAEQQGAYDVILVDSTEPVRAAVGLFSAGFYRSVHRALAADGILVAQTESPFYNGELLASSFEAMSSVFPITRVYLASVPTYPSGLWSFTAGSKRYDPTIPSEEGLKRVASMSLRYYTPGLHRAAFELPGFVRELLQRGAQAPQASQGQSPQGNPTVLAGSGSGWGS